MGAIHLGAKSARKGGKNCKCLDLRWMVPVFRFFEYVNFERKEQKVNSTS